MRLLVVTLTYQKQDTYGSTIRLAPLYVYMVALYVWLHYVYGQEASEPVKFIIITGVHFYFVLIPFNFSAVRPNELNKTNNKKLTKCVRVKNRCVNSAMLKTRTIETTASYQRFLVLRVIQNH